METIKPKKILKIQDNSLQLINDQLVVEEPLEIQLAFWKRKELEKISLSITMRTPGEDEALALGFLYTEGIIQSMADVRQVAHLPSWDAAFSENRIVVGLVKGIEIDISRFQRHFYTNSSCGICGKASIEALEALQTPEILPEHPILPHRIIVKLPQQLRKQQSIFDQTGGIHAAALFDEAGNLLIVQEDVGRHNALDKLIGKLLQSENILSENCLLLVSGRLSFELVQKALMARIPIIAAVGAPSSLAVELATEKGMTLLGFVKENQFNIYTGSERIHFED